MNILEDNRLKQSPRVVLWDCLAQTTRKCIKPSGNVSRARKNCSDNDRKVVIPAKKRRCSRAEEASKSAERTFEDSIDGDLTRLSSCEHNNSCKEESDSEQAKKKRKNELAEVERLEGYYRDKEGKMWYWMKWKNYSSKCNTWELIENLVNCNTILMKYFEYKYPTKKELSNMDQQVMKSLNDENLLKKSFSREDILDFPTYPTLDLKRIFTGNHETYRKILKREYKCILRCLIGMRYHKDKGLFARARQYKIALIICEMRKKQLDELYRQEARINKLEECPVKVINSKDLDVLPDFEYVTEIRAGKGVIIPNEPVVSCECPGGCNPASNCCGKLNESKFAYTMNRILDKSRSYPIYECNSKCLCSDNCPNRVVQKGRLKEVALFKTEKCGWGVKALKPIKRGEFICEYVGELISDKESNVREVEYSAKNLSFLFNLDFNLNREEAPFVIDATHCGNLSRFFNHSCDPNIEVRVVWINCLDPDKPRLAFFAKRYIKPDEELTFDYTSQEKGPLSVISKIRCFCNKPNCREWVWGF